MVAIEHAKRMEKFFDQWRRKVEYDMLEVMMDRNMLENMIHEELETNRRIASRFLYNKNLKRMKGIRNQ
ncbi:hypothetical protein HZA99_06255 [Candidatus Woesearchaeota archaeon]|nr:hypothetical protein [Candidatus Woesearchaeota archaeon]